MGWCKIKNDKNMGYKLQKQELDALAKERYENSPDIPDTTDENEQSGQKCSNSLDSYS